MYREIIRLEKASKTYGKGASQVTAVNEVSLRLEQGRFILLMGPSGSGKTTLLMMLGCLLKPTSGRVLLAGQEVSALDERKLPSIRCKHIGFVFQSFNLFPALTALENVEVALNLKGVHGVRAKEEATGLLEKVGLGHRLQHLPEDLSGGEKQRIAVARALAGDPCIILADEPTASLDSKNGRRIVMMLKSLAVEGNRSVLVVSHDNRIVDLADEIWTMEDGVVSRRSRLTQISWRRRREIVRMAI